MSKELTVNQNDLTIQNVILEIVKRTDVDPERLEKFLDLQIKMEERQAKQKFAESLAGFQGDCPPILKKKTVGFGTGEKAVSYSYSPLDEIVHIIKPVLQKWGLSFTFNCKRLDEKTNELITVVTHKQGHAEHYSHFYYSLHEGQGNTSQRLKSALTYAKRAALENALGLVTAGEDDDAKRAHDRMASEEQIEHIHRLILRTKSDLPKLLEFMKLDGLEGISDADADRAIHALKQKKQTDKVESKKIEPKQKSETKKTSNQFGPPSFKDDEFPDFNGGKK